MTHDSLATGAIAATTARDTLLASLISLAQRYGVTADAGRITQDLQLGPEIQDLELDRLAQALEISVTLRRTGWTSLMRMGDAFPMAARLKNGNTVILAGVTKKDGEDRVVVRDPLVTDQKWLFIPRDQFERSWSGEVLLVTPISPFSDDGEQFGLWWFTREIRRYRSAFSSVFAASLFTNLLAMVSPFFLMIVLDKVIAHGGLTTLHSLAIGAIVAVMFEGGFEFIRQFLVALSVRGIDNNLMAKVFNHALTLPIDYFEQSQRGIVARHLQQTERVRQFLTGRLFFLAVDLTFVALFVVVLFLINVQLAALIMATMLLLLGFSLATFPSVRAKIRQLYAADSRREAVMIETLNNMPAVKGLALEARQRRQWEVITAHTTRLRYQLNALGATSRAVTGLIEKLLWIGVIWLGAILVLDGEMTIGALVAINLLGRRVSGPLMQLANVVQEYQESLVSIRMLGDIMNRRPEQAAGEGDKACPQLNGRISFEDVSFRYTGAETAALDRVSVEIPSGAMVGLVGRSGSGKTTLMRLILGLYPLQAGSVRLDGFDIRELDHSHVRGSIGTVLQDNLLFRATIRENIAAGFEGATAEQVIRAAQLAGADEFIRRLPKAYETPLDEGGSNLSGGQRQRIALARALVRQPRILLLDEATSALDPESEAVIGANLAAIRRNRTVVISSHRLSMLVGADFIVVIDQGRIIDVGPHWQLLQRCELYRKLWDEQTRQQVQAAGMAR